MLGFISWLFGREPVSQGKNKKRKKSFVGVVTSKKEGYRGIVHVPVACFEIREDDSLILRRAAMDGHGIPIQTGDRVEMSLSREIGAQESHTESVQGEDGRVKVINTQILYYQIDEYRILPKDDGMPKQSFKRNN